MKRKKLMSKEKKCPKCGSERVNIIGGSHSGLGIKGKHIGLECFDCGVKFWISESNYKP